MSKNFFSVLFFSNDVFYFIIILIPEFSYRYFLYFAHDIFLLLSSLYMTNLGNYKLELDFG